MSCLSQPILCERLSSVGVRPPLGKCEKQNNRETEGVQKGSSSSHAVLKCASLKRQNGQLMEADARTLQRLWLF